MKKIALFLSFCLILASCEKKEVELAGEIPGMGNSSDELEVTAYELPEGIEIVGDISGIEEVAEAALSLNRDLKSATKNSYSTDDCIYGSGGSWIKLKITLMNTTNNNRTVFLPKGLIFKVDNNYAQHGILLQWVWFELKPNSTRTIYLDLYCINKGKNGSDISTIYELLGVTKSALMQELLNMIAWKKINYEHYHANILKSAKVDNVDYFVIIEQLQDAVWSITNGNGLTDEQIEFIESLPELEDGTYPDDLSKQPYKIPNYFEEYTPVD